MDKQTRVGKKGNTQQLHRQSENNSKINRKKFNIICLKKKKRVFKINVSTQLHVSRSRAGSKPQT